MRPPCACNSSRHSRRAHSEIKSARDDPHLYRAVLRSLHRPLSVLVTNLSGNLLPLIASPSFLSPGVPSPQSPNSTPTQLHALGLATFAGELLETFDEFGLGLDSDMRGDGLKNIRDSLVSTIKRVVEPLVNGIKNDLMPHIEALEQTSNVMAKTPGATKVTAAHPSIVYMAAVMPVYARALSRYITSASAESTLASLVISLIWRGLVALSNRPVSPASVTPPGSPPLGSAAKTLKDMKRRGSSATPPATPPASRFTLKLPPSRPPSPPLAGGKSTLAGDAKALYDLLAMLPRPTETLAREAVDDGYESLSALVALVEFIQAGRMGTSVFDVTAEIQALTTDIPVLIALPVLLRTFVFSPSSYTPERSVANLLGLTESAYRSGCLSGFGRAEECVIAVGKRILDVVQTCDGNAQGKEIVIHWLEHEVADAVFEQQH